MLTLLVYKDTKVAATQTVYFGKETDDKDLYRISKALKFI